MIADIYIVLSQSCVLCRPCPIYTEAVTQVTCSLLFDLIHNYYMKTMNQDNYYYNESIGTKVNHMANLTVCRIILNSI